MSLLHLLITTYTSFTIEMHDVCLNPVSFSYPLHHRWMDPIIPPTPLGCDDESDLSGWRRQRGGNHLSNRRHLRMRCCLCGLTSSPPRPSSEAQQKETLLLFCLWWKKGENERWQPTLSSFWSSKHSFSLNPRLFVEPLWFFGLCLTLRVPIQQFPQTSPKYEVSCRGWQLLKTGGHIQCLGPQRPILSGADKQCWTLEDCIIMCFHHETLLHVDEVWCWGSLVMALWCWRTNTNQWWVLSKAGGH